MESHVDRDRDVEHAHVVREALAIVAAFGGGLGALGLMIAAIGSVGPGRATWLWIGSAVLVAVSLSGVWWRYDAPDRRRAQRERERRGF